jgi:dTMP kinase
MGLFITFEGSEGCGKTTQVERLARRLPGVRVFREPGGTALGEEIRRILKASAPGWLVSPEAELLLFAASRAQLVREAIAPALAAGGVVLCDRFLDSTTVYQGVARSLDPGQVADINRFAIGDAEPDVTFLLDLPAATALERARARSQPLDRMEQEPAAFYEAVRAGYLALASAFPERFVVLDASASADDLEAAIWRQLTDRFHGLRPAHSA